MCFVVAGVANDVSMSAVVVVGASFVAGVVVYVIIQRIKEII